MFPSMRFDEKEEQSKFNNKCVGITEESNIVNVLCLGSADSGKSTFVERLLCNQSSLGCFSESFECLCRHISMIAKCYEQDGHQPLICCSEPASRILRQEEPINCTNPDDLYTILNEFEQMWNSTLKEYYNANKDLKHFSENMDHVFKDGKISIQQCNNYLYNSTNTTHKQIVRRFSTFGIELNLVTAGGKKMERRKWNSLDLEGTNLLLLFVSLSEFNQQTIEDSRTNRMDDSLKTFKEVITKKQLKNTRKVVIFTKPDILQYKMSFNTRYQRQICENVKERLKSVFNLNMERNVINSIIGEYEQIFYQYCKESKFKYHICNTINEEDVYECMKRAVLINQQPFISTILKRQDEKMFINKLHSSLNINFCDLTFKY